MIDTISRHVAIDAINHICPVDTEYDCTLLDRVDVRCVLSDLPPAQPERRTGRWLNVNESEKWECSECGRMMWFSPRLGVKPSDYRFCPNCGADMRGEEE